MKVGIIGSGGREHAICQSLKNSSKIDKIFSGGRPISVSANLLFTYFAIIGL